MTNHTMIGIDPGVVDTGVVCITFYPDEKKIWVDHKVFHKLSLNNVDELQEYVQAYDQNAVKHVVIEDYDARSNFNNDKHMASLVTLLKQSLPGAKALNNAGILTLIKPALMKALDVWTYPTPTNHNDLRSAARIALLAMAKDDTGLAELLSLVVKDHLYGTEWLVQHGD